MKEFNCKDVIPECDTQITGKDEDEVLQKAAKHGREKHGIEKLTDEMINKVRELIHEKREVA